MTYVGVNKDYTRTVIDDVCVDVTHAINGFILYTIFKSICFVML